MWLVYIYVCSPVKWVKTNLNLNLCVLHCTISLVQGRGLQTLTLKEPLGPVYYGQIHSKSRQVSLHSLDKYFNVSVTIKPFLNKNAKQC